VINDEEQLDGTADGGMRRCDSTGEGGGGGKGVALREKELRSPSPMEGESGGARELRFRSLLT
jgi:hypothetical protein